MASSSADTANQTSPTGLKRARTDDASVTSLWWKRRASTPSVSQADCQDAELPACHLPQLLDSTSPAHATAAHAAPTCPLEVKVDSKCGTTLDCWRRANPVIFSTRLRAADEDAPCSADHTAHTNPGDLAANCGYFHTLFDNHSKFSDTADTATLSVRTGISQELLHQMVEALYAHTITLDTTIVEEVLHTANFLGCQPLIAAASDYIAQVYLPDHFLEVSSLAHRLSLPAMAAGAHSQAIQQPWTPPHRARLRLLLRTFPVARARKLLASPLSAAVSELEVIDLVASMSTDKRWLDAIDFSRLGRAEVVALSRKIAALRCQGHSMAARYPCDSHTPCVRLPPLWEGLAAAALHFLSAGNDNRWPSHPGPAASKILRFRTPDPAAGGALSHQDFSMNIRQGYSLTIKICRLVPSQWGVVIMGSDSATGAPEPQQKLATQLNISLFLLAHGASLEEPIVHRLPSQAYTIDTGPCEMKMISFRSSANSGPEPYQVDLMERDIGYLELPGNNKCHAVGIWTSPIRS